MNSLNIGLDCGIRELSSEEIDLVSGGSEDSGGGGKKPKGLIGWLIGAFEAGRWIVNNREAIKERAREIGTDTVELHKDGFPMQL